MCWLSVPKQCPKPNLHICDGSWCLSRPKIILYCQEKEHIKILQCSSCSSTFFNIFQQQPWQLGFKKWRAFISCPCTQSLHVFAIYDAEPGHETTACSCCQATDLAAQWSDPPQQALGLQCSNNIKFSDLKICIKRNASYGVYTCDYHKLYLHLIYYHYIYIYNVYHQYVIRLDIHTGYIHHHTPSYTLWTHGAQDVHSMCKLFRSI